MKIVKSTGKYLFLLAIIAVVGLAGCTIAALVDTTAPTVSSTVPVDSATGVAINSNVTATFSEAMDAATISATTFTLKLGTTAVAGTVTYTGTVATFNPTSDLNQAAVYTATITTGAKDLAGNALAANEAWSFTTADTAAPSVVSTVPADSAVDVSIANNITATFSEAMSPATVTAATTFTLKQGATAVAGTVTYTGNTATFDPAAALAYETEYTATISVAATDLGGNPLEAAKVWSFTTALTPDTLAPTVLSTVPADSAIDVAITGNLTATFSEAMDPATIDEVTFLLNQGASAVTGVVSYTGTIATFNPDSNLSYSTVYTATITTGAMDPSGNALAASKIWSFTTIEAPDTTAPTVTSTVPADSAIDVSVTNNITATFSEAMATATVTAATFTLMDGITAVAGGVTYSGLTATFDPTLALENNTLYTATITTGATDLAGNALTASEVWTFTTVAAAPLGPVAVDLGTSANYVILAKAAVSTNPTSDITGDVGVSPAATTLLTGFSLVMVGTTSATSSQVTGSLYGADMDPPTSTNLTTAVADMEAAYTDAAGRVTPDFTNLGTGNIGGLTLVPGLYNWSTTVTIPSNITISGGANDVWIFQTTGDLSVSSAVIVTLEGGALAKNIFWQVAGAATIGTTAHFEGIILSATTITLGNGASMNGRALAQTAIALDQNVIVEPAP